VTAAVTVTCSCCQTPQAIGDAYEPVPGLGEYRCTDLPGCRRRMAYVGDPVGQVAASPPPVVSAAACSICGTTSPPGGVYERTAGMYACLDRPGCQARSVETQFLTAHREDFPEVATTKMTTRMHEARAAGAPAVSDGGTPDPEVIEQAYKDVAASRPRRAEADLTAWVQGRG
jgi:hypothetical protein